MSIDFNIAMALFCAGIITSLDQIFTQSNDYTLFDEHEKDIRVDRYEVIGGKSYELVQYEDVEEA